MAFDPDAYLAKKSGFDPDRYIQKKDAEVKPLMDKAKEYPSRGVEISKTPMGIAKQVIDFANPFPASPTTNPVSMLEEKRKFLESAGRSVKDAAIGAEGNIVSKTSELARKYLPKDLADFVQTQAALTGGGVATATELSPLGPSDFSLQAGFGIVGPAAGQATRGIQTAIANRNLQAPKLIREARYSKGQPSVGEVALDTKVADLAVKDKDTMYRRVSSAIDTIGQKIRNRIQEIYAKSSAEGPGIKVSEKVPERTIPFNEEIPTQKTDVPESLLPYTGIKERGALGEPVRPVTPQYNVAPNEQTPPLSIGGFERTSPIPKEPTPGSFTRDPMGVPINLRPEPDPPGLYPQTKLGGFERNTTIPAQPNRIKSDLTVAPRVQPNSISTKEVASAVDPIIERTIAREGPDSQVVKNLIGLKERFIARNGDFMDFFRANNERIFLGDDIGKGFNKDTSALPEIMEAERAMWGAIRDRLGKISPELDELLRLQHDLLDVRTSALPEAALGYTKTANDVVGLVKAPFRRIEIADFLGNTLPKTAPLGVVSGVGAKTATKAVSKSISDLIGERQKKNKKSK